MSGAKVLITPRSLSDCTHPALDALREVGLEPVSVRPGVMPNEADLIGAMPGCVAWLAGVEPVSEKVIDAASELKVISRNGTGIDNLPLQVLAEKGIKVCKASGANARSVAELALSYILTGLRQLTQTHVGIQAGEWPRLRGREIKGATVGILGLGAIGQELAQICLSLGANVIAYDPYTNQDAIQHQNFQRGSLAEVVKKSDAISLHCPMPEDGSAVLGPKEVGACMKGAVLVNTARAGLIDQTALASLLESGQIGFYGTDVFESEPPQRVEMLNHPGVTMSSHIGGFTTESVDRATMMAVQNILGCLDGPFV